MIDEEKRILIKRILSCDKSFLGSMKIADLNILKAAAINMVINGVLNLDEFNIVYSAIDTEGMWSEKTINEAMLETERNWKIKNEKRLLEKIERIMKLESILNGLEKSVEQYDKIMNELYNKRSALIPGMCRPTPNKRNLRISDSFRPSAPLSIEYCRECIDGNILNSSSGFFQKCKSIFTREKEARKMYEQGVYDYNEKLNEFNEMEQTLYNNQPKINHLSDKITTLGIKRKEIENFISNTKHSLMLAYCVVHEKYRNLIAVSAIHDYLSTGRTHSLEQNENDPGAYNLYENDINFRRLESATLYSGKQLFDKLEELNFSISNSLQSLNQTASNSYNILCDLSPTIFEIANATERNNKLLQMNNRLLDINNTIQGDIRDSSEEIAYQTNLQTDSMREGYLMRTLTNKSGAVVDSELGTLPTRRPTRRRYLP